MRVEKLADEETAERDEERGKGDGEGERGPGVAEVSGFAAALEPPADEREEKEVASHPGGFEGVGEEADSGAGDDGKSGPVLECEEDHDQEEWLGTSPVGAEPFAAADLKDQRGINQSKVKDESEEHRNGCCDVLVDVY